MNLYLVTCSNKPINSSTPEITPNLAREVYVVAEDLNTAENEAFLLVHKLSYEVGYVSNIRLLASDNKDQADGLLAIAK